MRLVNLFFAAIAAFSASASAISVGDTAPLFSLPTYDGGTFNLAQQKGKVKVLLFLCSA